MHLPAAEARRKGTADGRPERSPVSLGNQGADRKSTAGSRTEKSGMQENKIRNAKDEIIADIQKLEEELPENCQQNKDYIFPFDDAFIKTDCGNIKIKEIKFEYENHTEMKQFKIDAQNITKAILKNTISKEVQLIGKTYMDYKSQMK